jgi:glutathione S-transferase
MTTITVPESYGYVILATTFGSLFFSPLFIGSQVMNAREKYNVPYPNLYATPGYHKEADAFNRIQRGHQSMFESLSCFGVCNLIGGLKHPIACSVFAGMYSIGCYLFLQGYADTGLDVKTARFKKGK